MIALSLGQPALLSLIGCARPTLDDATRSALIPHAQAQQFVTLALEGKARAITDGEAARVVQIVIPFFGKVYTR